MPALEEQMLERILGSWIMDSMWFQEHLAEYSVGGTYIIGAILFFGNAFNI